MKILIEINKGDAEVFQMIREQNLYNTVQDLVLPLLKFKDQEALRLLVNNTDKIPVSKLL